MNHGSWGAVKRILQVWVASSLFCAVNGFLIYLLAPQSATSGGNPWTTPTAGALQGLALAAVATIAAAIVILVRQRHS